nr:MAG TPA: hypothetical protein [Inoviridae sp.]
MINFARREKSLINHIYPLVYQQILLINFSKQLL